MRKIKFGAVCVLAAGLGVQASAVAAAAQAGSVGEQGPATAEPAVPRPPTSPCAVPLFTHTLFAPHGDPTAMNARPERWQYAPPAACPGPWSAVVLEADFAVTAGRQYDRTASLWLRGVNLFYGTTREPGATVAPHWHVERDLTDYAALFRQPGEGRTILNNWVDRRYTGVISGSARLLFYPAAKNAPAAEAAGRVYGLDGDQGGAPVNVETSQDALARTLTLPRDIDRVALDLIAQSQATDEQWYMCIDDADLGPSRAYSLGPPASGDPLEQCGHGSFREVVVSIDGVPAGLAPVYPWTYTGGVDPHLWRPVPDIETLNFVPWHMDLTPFAGLLDDGRPHTVAVRVLGAHHFFALAANLLVFEDRPGATLSGRVERNTLSAALPVPHVERRWHGDARGQVSTRAGARYNITGVLDTPRGPVRTSVAQQMTFVNRQSFAHPDAATYHQVFHQLTRVTETVTTTGAKRSAATRSFRYPLAVDVRKHVQPAGAFTANIRIEQGFLRVTRSTAAGKTPFRARLSETRSAHDTADFNATGTSIRNARSQGGFEQVRYYDSLGSCYNRRIDVANEVATSLRSGQGCAGGKDRLAWRAAVSR